MSESIAVKQDSQVTPPVVGKILAITLDATSRRYDLGGVDFGGTPVAEGGMLFLCLKTDVKCYVAFNSSDAGTVDETAALAAGGSVSAFTSNGAWEIEAGVEFPVYVNRLSHRYLVVKGSAAGTLRIRAGSPSSIQRGA